MIKLIETKISCPKDGFNIYRVTREPDAIAGTATESDTEEMEPVCRKCDPKRYIEILRHARVITLQSDNEPQQKLKPRV